MGPSKRSNLFDGIPDKLPKEISETLLGREGFHILRIVSQGQTTDWLTQDFNEWVVLLSGAARISFKGESHPRRMKPGDYIFIPAGCCHRVAWTDAVKKSVWLAVHHKAAGRLTKPRVKRGLRP